ncbi:hypothetical protein BpHYR1_040786, partial [Brachionus plicatilis]
FSRKKAPDSYQCRLTLNYIRVIHFFELSHVLLMKSKNFKKKIIFNDFRISPKPNFILINTNPRKKSVLTR